MPFDLARRPLFQSFTSRFHQSKPLLMAVMENFAHWQAVSKGPPSTPVRGDMHAQQYNLQAHNNSN